MWRRLVSWLGRDRRSARARREAARPRSSSQPSTTTGAACRQIVQLAFREALTRAGIPVAWMALEVLRSVDARGRRGTHVRVRIQHWDPRLARHLVALETQFVRRIRLLDGSGIVHLQGIAWMFDLPESHEAPPLPQAQSWTADAG